jgi:dihydropteroate synthase
MTININGRLIDFSSPCVMGILNITPDSFYDGGKLVTEADVLKQVENMLIAGAGLLDIGGMSSRPGAEIITEQEELERVLPHIKSIAKKFPHALISVDTIRAGVAEESLKAGASIINDISAGRFDERMLSVVSKYKAPFIVMHMKDMPGTMQHNPQYENVTTEVLDFFAERISACRKAGIVDLILDPGFGFGKTVEHNYTLLRNLKYFTTLNAPILAGASRKGMIYKVLGVSPSDALNGTTVVNTIALLNGATILRVHDVKEAREAVKIVAHLTKM